MEEQGTVKWWNMGKGYGFVSRERGEDVYVHFENLIPKGTLHNLAEGDRVSLQVVIGPKGYEGRNIRKIS